MWQPNLMEDLKLTLNVGFMQKALHSYLITKKAYSKFLIMNYNKDFLILSNDNLYVLIILLPNKENIQKAKDKLEFIFNREKHMISFNKIEIDNTITYINTNDMIKHAVTNGIIKNNLFLRRFKEAFIIN